MKIVLIVIALARSGGVTVFTDQAKDMATCQKALHSEKMTALLKEHPEAVAVCSVDGAYRLSGYP